MSTQRALNKGISFDQVQTPKSLLKFKDFANTIDTQQIGSGAISTKSQSYFRKGVQKASLARFPSTTRNNPQFFKKSRSEFFDSSFENPIDTLKKQYKDRLEKLNVSLSESFQLNDKIKNISSAKIDQDFQKIDTFSRSPRKLQNVLGKNQEKMLAIGKFK